MLNLSFEMKEMIVYEKMNYWNLELNELMEGENTLTVECIQGYHHLSSASPKYIKQLLNLTWSKKPFGWFYIFPLRITGVTSFMIRINIITGLMFVQILL